MNSDQIKRVAISKAKSVAAAATSSGNKVNGKSRRKGTDLKPIITTENQHDAEDSTVMATNS